MTEAEIVARVEADRHHARVEALLDSLRSIAQHGSDKPPRDYISDADARACYDRQEAWHDGHDAGSEMGRWLAGNEAQDALDAWVRDA